MFLYLDNIDPLNTTQITEHEIKYPSWEDVLDALNKLNQKRHTLLSLNRGERSLMVGGGPEHYISVRTTEFTSHSLLLNGAKKSVQVSQICIGGQVGDYPSNMLVPKDIAKKAISAFYNENVCDLKWVED